MSWATRCIADLQAGKTVKFRPHGNSMSGRVESGQLCTISPDTAHLKVGDIVLCRCNGQQYLHLVSAFRTGQYQISNNKGRVNGWVSRAAIFGVLIHVVD